MYTHPPRCPNPTCKYNNPENIDQVFYIKKGYYTLKYNYQPVPKYQCKECKKWFSSHTFRDTFRQHKPHLNETVFKLIVSGVTLRRTAKLVGLAKRTVERKFAWLATRAEKFHHAFIDSGGLRTDHVQMDEMETCEGNKKRPLTVALAVDSHDGKIIDIRVSKMLCKGRLAKLNPNHREYWNIDNRREKFREVLETVKKVSHGTVTIVTDMKTAYKTDIPEVIPHAIMESHKRMVERDKDEHDPMFWINLACAKIRADMSRMRRRTWAITKKWENLQKHLYTYIAWHNEYALF